MVPMVCWVSRRSQLNKDICPQNLSVGCFHYTPNCKIFLSPTLIQEALLGSWWEKGPKDWTVNKLLLISPWSSASKMSIVVFIVMHFPGFCFQNARRRNTDRRSRISTPGWVKRIHIRPHFRVHPINDPAEGTVENFSLGSLKNNYSSLFSASYLRKNYEILSSILLFHVFKLKLTKPAGTVLTMEVNMHLKFNIWFMFKSEDGL